MWEGSARRGRGRCQQLSSNSSCRIGVGERGNASVRAARRDKCEQSVWFLELLPRLRRSGMVEALAFLSRPCSGS